MSVGEHEFDSEYLHNLGGPKEISHLTTMTWKPRNRVRTRGCLLRRRLHVFAQKLRNHITVVDALKRQSKKNCSLQL